MNIVRFVQPTNLAEEREKFLQSKRYQPQFRYGWEEVTAVQWAMKTTKYKGLVRVLLDQDYSSMSEEASKVFETRIEAEVMKSAWVEAKREMVKLSAFTLEQIIKAQRQALKLLGVDYEVVASSQVGFIARPEHAKRRLVISREIQHGIFSRESSIRHDMVHVVRYVNGKVNGVGRSKNYLPTEEGLATYMQDYGGDEPNNSLKQHAAEYAVTEVMLNGTLREGYDIFRSFGFSPELAWQRAARHKYGWKDTSQPGDIMKPAMYYGWSQKILQLTADERLRLMVGKIGLGELDVYPAYRGVVARRKLNELFKW